MYFQCFLLVGFALNMLVTPYLGNYSISMNPRAIRVVALAALGTLQCGGPWDPLVPSNRVYIIYLLIFNRALFMVSLYIRAEPIIPKKLPIILFQIST